MGVLRDYQCAMDPDEVAHLVTELKLSSNSEKEPTLTIEDDALKIGEQRLGNCLVAKVFSRKEINRETFVQQISRILQANTHIEIGSVGHNIFLLDFKSPQDRRWALSGGLGNFFRDLIIFREPRSLQTPSSMTFDDLSIWVQCYNLPLVLMYKDFLEKVGSQIGVVKEIDTRENGLAMGRYVRMMSTNR